MTINDWVNILIGATGATVVFTVLISYANFTGKGLVKRSIPEPSYIPPRPQTDFTLGGRLPGISGKDILEVVARANRAFEGVQDVARLNHSKPEVVAPLEKLKKMLLPSINRAKRRKRATAGIYGPWPKPKR
jgi:hypothetical protein